MISLNKQTFPDPGIICILNLPSRPKERIYISSIWTKRFWTCNVVALLIVQMLSCVWLCNPMDSSVPDFPGLHHLPELAQTHVHWASDAVPTISFSAMPFSSFPQIFPSIRVFSKSCLFISDDQSIGASASVFAMNIQGWFPLVLTGVISLLSKGFSRVFLWASFNIWHTGEKFFNLCHRLSSFLSSFHITTLHFTPETNIMNQIYFDKKYEVSYHIHDQVRHIFMCKPEFCVNQ